MNSNEIESQWTQDCIRRLLGVWLEFERNMSKVPVVQRLEQDRLSQEDYVKLLLNLRQQVIEGSRWISRCASSFSREYSDIRSLVISHANEEHLDYKVMEKDYLAAGGDLDVLYSEPKNLGSEALHAFMMYRASLPNPIDLIGAMWIIEGVGEKMAAEWASSVEKIFSNTKGSKNVASFMRYHGENDETHMEKLHQIIGQACRSEADCIAIERTARVVGKLYVMQLEEVDRDSGGSLL
jgi:3-oxoacyl-[acyl-carrier-protein] synthase-3